MRVIILTQEDSFFIPGNIAKAINVCEVLEIVNLNSKGSLTNKSTDFLRWFGFSQVLQMGFRVLSRKILGVFDQLSGYSLMGGCCSVKAIAKNNSIPYRTIKDVNSIDFFEHIRCLTPDLIVSYSAPQIIREPLLSFPRYGIINVHGSLLPDYRGCLPSFWHLFNDEKWGGATVHYMSKNIDDGAIVLREKIELTGCKSMFEVMRLTKKLGGNLVVNAIQQIKSGTVRAMPNIQSEGRYYSWPTVTQAKQFLAKGYRLI